MGAAADVDYPVDDTYTSEDRRKVAWIAGNLSWKLDSAQRQVYEQILRWLDDPAAKWGMLNCARRWGKDRTTAAVCLHVGLTRPKARIPYASKTHDQVRELLLPTIEELIEDCPDFVRPRWVESRSAYEFPGTRARLILMGLDYRPDRLRGPYMDFGCVSEAGYITNLRYVIRDVFHHMMLKRDRSFLLLNSTPPPTPDHEYSTYYAPQAKSLGRYVHRTIFDNPRLTLEEIAREVDEAGGIDSPTCRRELLAEFVVDLERAVIPEFAEVEADIVQEVERPTHFDPYVAMDVGFRDLTFAVFGYWDFKHSRHVIEDEVVINRMTTAELAAKLRETEERLWGSKAPRGRVSDTDLRLIHDLGNLHNLTFSPTRKDEKQAGINQLRMEVGAQKVIIHPRCQRLVAHLRHGIWDKRGKSYERSDNQNGHFDGIDALLYFVRNVDRARNPYPVLAPDVTVDSHHVRPAALKSREQRGLSQWLGRRGRRYG